MTASQQLFDEIMPRMRVHMGETTRITGKSRRIGRELRVDGKEWIKCQLLSSRHVHVLGRVLRFAFLAWQRDYPPIARGAHNPKVPNETPNGGGSL